MYNSSEIYIAIVSSIHLHDAYRKRRKPNFIDSNPRTYHTPGNIFLSEVIQTLRLGRRKEAESRNLNQPARRKCHPVSSLMARVKFFKLTSRKLTSGLQAESCRFLSCVHGVIWHFNSQARIRGLNGKRLK